MALYERAHPGFGVRLVASRYWKEGVLEGSEFTRIDLFWSRSGPGWSTNFAVTRWRVDGEVLTDVTPGDSPGLQRQGGFGEAFVKAWRMSSPGETALVRVHRRDKRQEWRVVNSYRVQFPRRVWVRPAEWDRGRS